MNFYSKGGGGEMGGGCYQEERGIYYFSRRLGLACEQGLCQCGNIHVKEKIKMKQHAKRFSRKVH